MMMQKQSEEIYHMAFNVLYNHQFWLVVGAMQEHKKAILQEIENMCFDSTKIKVDSKTITIDGEVKIRFISSDMNLEFNIRGLSPEGVLIMSHVDDITADMLKRRVKTD